MTGKMGKPLTCFNLFSRSSIFDNLKALKVCKINSCRFFGSNLCEILDNISGRCYELTRVILKRARVHIESNFTVRRS